MAKQKKIMDVHEGHAHLTVVRNDTDRGNPYRIYLIISPTGAPIQRRILNRYDDFISVLSFIRDFYRYGIDTMCYTDMLQWVRNGCVF